jgi:hypothetical protein
LSCGILETGARIEVPEFVQVGDVIKVDTRTCTYVERAKPCQKDHSN